MGKLTPKEKKNIEKIENVCWVAITLFAVVY